MLTLHHFDSTIEIRCVGGFSVSIAGSRVPLEGKRAGDLLKALVALGGRDVSGRRLTDAVWPDAEGDAGRRSLDTTLHRLRRLLGNRAITLLGGRLGLNPALCWVDAWEIEQTLGQDRSALDPGSTERLLALYRGQFLPDSDAGGATVSYRTRLHEQVLGYLTRVGAEVEQRGHWQEGILAYQRALLVDDTHEPFYQGLIRCYGELGRCAEFARALTRAEAVLSAKWGSGPSRQTLRIAAHYHEQARSA